MGEAELNARRKKWKRPPLRLEDRRGYRKLFLESVTQADRGCDFDFCVPESTTRVPKDNLSPQRTQRTRRKSNNKN